MQNRNDRITGAGERVTDPNRGPRVAVIAEFYPSNRDPVLGIWAHRQALAQGGQPVSMDQMQPGDLVTYYSDASHVAIYIGDGMMVHASTFGVPVRVAPVDNAPIFNVRRY